MIFFQTSRLLQVQHHPIRVGRHLRDRELRVRQQRRRDRVGRVQDRGEGREQNVPRVRPRYHDHRTGKGTSRGGQHAPFHSTHGRFGAQEPGKELLVVNLF